MRTHKRTTELKHVHLFRHQRNYKKKKNENNRWKYCLCCVTTATPPLKCNLTKAPMHRGNRAGTDALSAAYLALLINQAVHVLSPAQPSTIFCYISEVFLTEWFFSFSPLIRDGRDAVAAAAAVRERGERSWKSSFFFSSKAPPLPSESGDRSHFAQWEQEITGEDFLIPPCCCAVRLFSRLCQR